MYNKPKLNLEAIRKEKESRESLYGSQFYEIKEGENPLRLLPRSVKAFTPEGDTGFAIRYWVHYNLFDVEGYRLIVCSRTVGGNCPFCEYVMNLEDKTKASQLRARERFLYNVVDLRDNKLKVLETGPMIYDGFLNYILQPEWGEVLDLKEGNAFKIIKIPPEKSSTGWADYNVLVMPQKVDVTPFLPENWDEVLDSLKNRVPVVRTDKELKKLLDCYLRGVPPHEEEMEKRRKVLNERKVEIEGGSLNFENKSGMSELQKKAEEIAGKLVEGQENKESFFPSPSSPPPPSQSVPQCFGRDFNPRKPQCKSCEYWAKCRDVFIRDL